MGTLIVTEMVTVDGVAQAPSGPDEDRGADSAYGGWEAPYVNAEVENLMFASPARWTPYCWGAGRMRSSRVGVK